MPAPLIGRTLRKVRADGARGIWSRSEFAGPETISVSSSSFQDGGALDPRHRGEGAGENVSPALEWTNVPDGARQMVLVIEDIDVPLPRPLVHTAAVLPPTMRSLQVGDLRADGVIRFLRTQFGRTGYHGPRPLVGHGPHRYRFELYALDSVVPEPTADLRALTTAASGHVLAKGSLTGIDER